MKIVSLVSMLVIFSFSAAQAQDSTKVKKKPLTTQQKLEKVKETVNEIPDMLIAQPDKGPDTNANKLRNENLVITVNPIWQEKGLQMGNDLKLQKVNDDPLAPTFPLADKKIVNGLTITMQTIKKLPEDKKQMAIAQVKKDLAAVFKDAQKTGTGEEVKAMVTGPEVFKTDEGKLGELYLINDIAVQQSSFIVLWMTPGAKPGTTTLVQFQYFKYLYDTIYQDDVMELRLFQFPDDQKAYVDFTKNILKTLKIH